MISEKKCSNCFQVKPISEFHRKGNGYQSRCKDPCNNEVARAWRKKAQERKIKEGWDKVHGRES